MTISERIKLLRKYLGLTQSAFAEKIGLKATAVGLYESGSRAVTERSIISICQAFNIREEWLRTGKGEMIQSEKAFSLDEYVRLHNFSDIEMRIFKAYLEIPADLREKVLGYVSRAFTADAEIDREVQSYREELEAEKKVEVVSPASPDTKEA